MKEFSKRCILFLPLLNNVAFIKRFLLLLLTLVAFNVCSQDLQDWGKYENVKQKAIKRIEKHRKGGINLKILLPNQDVAANTQIRVKLKRHNFKWGAVVSESFVNSPYAEIYKQNFLKFFNATGFTVALKPKFRDTQREKTTETISLPWFLENNIYVRGHTLTWEGEKFIRPEDRALYNNTKLSNREKGERLLQSCARHFAHAIPKWNVKCWDVSNEPIANNIVNNLLPDKNSHVHWFKLADSIRKQNGKEKVKLFQNDYQIISAITPYALNFTKKGYSAVGRPALYREILDEQIALGAPIEGIGFQSRIKGGVISPDTIYKRLCDFDRFNLPYHATEFEIRDNKKTYVYTNEERMLITEYMMVMYFSHPKVEGFWHWTFADKRNKKLDYSLFNYDGTPNVNGQKWIDLMEGFFDTDETLMTNSEGELNLRGYYGTYQINTEIEGHNLVASFEIDNSENNLLIQIILEEAP